MEVIAGSYAHTINYSTLCDVAPGDGPSTTLSRMRARRVVSVRETASGEKHTMRADIYKRICVPFSKIIARPCFGTANIVYSPQHLMLFCSNQPIQIDDNDEAVKARTAIIDHTAVFVDNPVESNESQRMDLSRGVLIAKYRVGVFWLLQRIQAFPARKNG
jgi:phage/plasmid-associated DNA primase